VPEPGLTVTLGWAKDAVSCANAPEQVAIITRAASVFFMFRGRGGACRGGGYKLGISAAAARSISDQRGAHDRHHCGFGVTFYPRLEPIPINFRFDFTFQTPEAGPSADFIFSAAATGVPIGNPVLVWGRCVASVSKRRSGRLGRCLGGRSERRSALSRAAPAVMMDMTAVAREMNRCFFIRCTERLS
jgi:hypothetical protein